jgi:hypothetical protein
MKKTAVEWLYEHILLTPLDIRSINKCLEQAKEMEKEQIVNAYESLEHRHGENYYNETFKN